jgi:hypothetical protein
MIDSVNFAALDVFVWAIGVKLGAGIILVDVDSFGFCFCFCFVLREG